MKVDYRMQYYEVITYLRWRTAANITRKLCYRKDDRAMREPLRRYTTGCGDMAI